MSTYVYFISAGSNPIKIGVSDTPQDRLRALQTSHYKQLRLLFSIECTSREKAFQLETAFHRWYAKSKLKNEWFNISPLEIQDDINLLNHVQDIMVGIVQHTSTAIIEDLDLQRVKSNRVANAKEQVIKHLEKYPDDVLLNVRDLAEKLGVGKTTVAEVMKGLKQ